MNLRSVIFSFLFVIAMDIPTGIAGPDLKALRHARVAEDIKSISTQLMGYRIPNGFYPTTKQGLSALVTMPESDPKPSFWVQMFKTLPKDPWGNDYIYICPGTKKPDGYDLYSAGPDGKANTSDDDWGD